MTRMGVIIVIGAIIASIVFANYTYTQYTTNYIEAVAGTPIIVGPVEYTIIFEGTHEGSKDVTPENTFVKIGITAKDISDKPTTLSGGQFYIVGKDERKHEAVFGEFSSKDLFLETLEPNKPIERTTQFDIPFDEDERYKIIIRPQKDQSTIDTAVVCITNC